MQDAGYDVWWDRKLGGGSFFAHEIEKELKGAGAVIVVWSAAAAASHWVVDEASAGRDAAKLVPISLDGTAPPLGFRQLHTIVFSGEGGDDAGFADLTTAIERLCADGPLRSREPRALAASTNRSGVFAPDPASGARAPIKAPHSPLQTALRRHRGSLATLLAVAIAGAGFAAIEFARRPAGEVEAAAPETVVAVRPAPAGATIAVLSLRGDAGAVSSNAERLTRDIEAALTREPWLSVESSRSVASAAARGSDISTMAAEMGVAYLVDGELYPAANGVRANVQLFAAASGASVWSLAEEFPAEAIASGAVAAQVANAIWRNVYLAEAARVREARLETLSARELLALALSGVRHAPWTEDGVREAIGVLAAAVAAYPDDAEVLATAAQADLTLSLIDTASAARLREAAEERLARAFALNPQSRWVESVAGDVNFAAGRYYAAAEGYDRLLKRSYDLPATRAREADARARVTGAFAPAARIAEAEAAKAFTPLQRSQTHAAAAYLSAASGDAANALDHARRAVAAFPNNPDAVMSLVIVAMLAGEDAALSESVRAFCNFYPSFDYPAPNASAVLRAQLEGDGGAEWRQFIARVFEAYAARWSLIDAACQ